jgi:hypothetical protein
MYERRENTESRLLKVAHMSPTHLRGRASDGSKHLRRRDDCWVGQGRRTSSRWRLDWDVLVEGTGAQVMSKILITMVVCHLTYSRPIMGGSESNHAGGLGGGMEGQCPSSTRLRCLISWREQNQVH